MQADKEIDTKGLNCPLPILRAKKALAEMSTGQLLKVVATDPGSMRDFLAFAKQTGNELVEQEAVGDEFIHVLHLCASFSRFLLHYFAALPIAPVWIDS